MEEGAERYRNLGAVAVLSGPAYDTADLRTFEAVHPRPTVCRMELAGALQQAGYALGHMIPPGMCKAIVLHVALSSSYWLRHALAKALLA